MTPSWETMTVGIGLLATMAAYALFAGADFGGGIWDLLAGGTKRGERPRAAIDASLTPVWEGNNVWIVLGLVLLWTGFPTAFAAVMTALFVPLSFSLLGIFFRGVGFAFRHEAERLPTKRLSGAMFAASSLLAPFFLGTCVGAVTTGGVAASARGNAVHAWTSPTAITTGVLFTCSCAYISAVFLVGDSDRRGDQELIAYFRLRALIAGAVTGVVAGADLLLLRTNATYVYGRLTGVALPLVIVSVVAGIVALGLIAIHRPWPQRIAAAIAVMAVIAAWGLAQYPYVLPTSLTAASASAPTNALLAEIVVLGLAAILVVPSFAYLYWLQQHEQLMDSETSDELRRAVAAQRQAEGAAAAAQQTEPPGPTTALHRVATTVVVVAALVEAIRDRASSRRG